MKTIMIIVLFVMQTLFVFAQSPQSFQYQSVVRDGNGDVVVNQLVSFQISLISGSATGTVMYVETHSATTNAFGLVILAIGEGTLVSGSFSGIDWSSAPHFIKVEVDITGGTSYVDMGTNQLLSVPYALNSKTSEDAFSGNYSDLTGVPTDVSTFNNDAGYITNPNDADADPSNEIQTLGIVGNNLTISGANTVALPQTTYTAGSGINITGTTITNTAPNQTVTLTSGGATTISGSYPSFTISSTDNNSGGTVTSIATNNGITGGTITTTGTLGLTGQALSFHNLATTGLVVKMGTGITSRTISAGNGIIVSSGDGLAGNPTIAANIGTTSTTVAAGDHLHSAYNPAGIDGYIQYNDNGVFGANADLFWDKTNARMGVGLTNPNGRMVVQGSAAAAVTDPLFEVKDDAGYTVFVVYKDSARFYFDDDASKTNKGTFAVSGRNTAKAFTHNYLLVSPDSTRIWTGDTVAGFGVENVEASTSGSYMHLNPSNYFIGHYSGANVTTGLYNSTFGYKADSALTTGNANIAIGYKAGMHNSSGKENVFIGYQSGLSNTVGDRNLFLGRESGNSNIDGIYNQFLGYQSGYFNTSGGHNNFIGYQAGYHNTTGWTNNFIGGFSGYDNTTGTQNVFFGASSGANNTTGSNNVYIGHRSGLNNVTGSGNLFIGFEAGLSETGTDKLYIENSGTTTTPLIHGDFANDRIAFHRMATTYPLQVGTGAANGNQAYLTAGGTWTNTSSKTLKDRFSDLDKPDLLSKIENMEIKGWFYKETMEYHIGPFAEDFYSAFGTGVLDEPVMLGKSLAAGDVAGVSLAAVKELIIQNKEQQNEIEKLKTESQSLQMSIEKMQLDIETLKTK